MNNSSIKLPLEYVLDNRQINKMHAEFLWFVEQLTSVGQEMFTTTFNKFVESTEKQIAEKNDWMKASRFPGYQENAVEHSKVLDTLKSMQNEVQQGQITTAEAWVKDEALECFQQHLLKGSKALSNHLQSLSSTKKH